MYTYEMHTCIYIYKIVNVHYGVLPINGRSGVMINYSSFIWLYRRNFSTKNVIKNWDLIPSGIECNVHQTCQHVFPHAKFRTDRGTINSKEYCIYNSFQIPEDKVVNLVNTHVLVLER